MITLKSGNFFDYEATIRVNTVNCVGVMGAGVALQFKNLFPKMFIEYKDLCSLKEIRPGKLHIWESENIFEDLVIINFPTKDHWKDPSEYDYVEKGLESLYNYLRNSPRETITIPALGCGHGGLDWNIVKSMIYEKLSDLDHNILLFSPESSKDIPINDVNLLAKNNIHSITPDDKKFPKKIKGKTSKIVYYLGNEELLNTKIINIISSKQPTEKEKDVLFDILKELKEYNSKYTVLLRGDKSFELDIIRFLLENKINTIVNPSKGLINFNIRKDLKNLINHSNFLIYNTLKNQSDNWSVSNFSSNYKESFYVSDIDLFNISDLSEIVKLVKSVTSTSKKFYYINYFSKSLAETVKDKSFEKIGKTQEGKPNIQKILY
jgi:O-acetyl-ADP-ribose deacetylase (regulator of RNase III)